MGREAAEVGLARLAEHAIPVLETKDETGATRDGRVAYLDTRSMLGVILELIQPATQRVVDEIYPKQLP